MLSREFSWYVFFFFANEFVLKGGSVTSVNVRVGVPVFFSLSPACSLSVPCQSLRPPPLTTDWLLKLSLIIK